MGENKNKLEKCAFSRTELGNLNLQISTLRELLTNKTVTTGFEILQKSSINA